MIIFTVSNLIGFITLQFFRLTGCEFFEQFQTYSKEEEWKYFVTRLAEMFLQAFFLPFFDIIPLQNVLFFFTFTKLFLPNTQAEIQLKYC